MDNFWTRAGKPAAPPAGQGRRNARPEAAPRKPCQGETGKREESALRCCTGNWWAERQRDGLGPPLLRPGRRITMAPDDRLLTRKEAASVLRIEPQTLAKRERIGKPLLPVVRVHGKALYWQSDLSALIDRSVVGAPTSTPPQASCPRGYWSAGLCPCWSRHGLRSWARRLASIVRFFMWVLRFF